MEKEEIKKRLEEIAGKEWVRDDAATLFLYSRDMTENEPHAPDWVVMPEKPEQVQAVMRLANETLTPVTPYVSGANVGGLTIPVKGGIILDLKRMNRILEINESDMYALLEPGVTFGHLRAELDRNHPKMIYTYPMAPPFTSVTCNALLDGLCNLSHPHGATSDWINSLEVVLPSGELARIGSAAISGRWVSRVPLPDLAGLFIGWQGLTGIVTKIAVQLCPKPAFLKRAFILPYSYSTAYEMMRELSWTRALDDIAGLSWVAGKMMYGRHGPISRDPGEPGFILFIEYSAKTRAELWSKTMIVNNLLKDFEKKGKTFEGPLDINAILRFFPEYAKLANFPTTLDFLLDYAESGGFSWVGSYGPTSNWTRPTEKGTVIMEKYGFPPLFNCRSMKGGHYGALRFLIPFDRRDPEVTKKLRACLEEICDLLLDEGFIPYKAPNWAAKKIISRADPGWVNLLKTVKNTLDPNGILNPGHWGF
ncbi:MAG: FAD-binding oxidoreductase [Proteobacteria bacterium]|nr:FAD-binding oxidoreductase [Pseudomonadota bacterium]